jgi:hypothetical protein
MSESIALELPEPLAKKVKEIAALNRQGIEEMLIEWIDRTISDIPIDTLSDEQVLALTLRAGRAIATEYTIVGRIAVFLQ